MTRPAAVRKLGRDASYRSGRCPDWVTPTVGLCELLHTKPEPFRLASDADDPVREANMSGDLVRVIDEIAVVKFRSAVVGVLATVILGLLIVLLA